MYTQLIYNQGDIGGSNYGLEYESIQGSDTDLMGGG